MFAARRAIAPQPAGDPSPSYGEGSAPPRAQWKQLRVLGGSVAASSQEGRRMIQNCRLCVCV